MADLPLDPSSCLPDDGTTGTLIGRCWLPGAHPGPAVVAVRSEGVFDLSRRFATVSDVLDDAAPAAAVRATDGRRIGTLAEVLRHTAHGQRDAPHLLAPVDLQVIKAAFEESVGPDADLFTKAPLLSALGTGVAIGVRGDSAWSNPEPEVVLAVNSRARIVGATLGNDVNLRDLDGRGARLLGHGKDHNGAAAIGPFIRLFDAGFSLDDVRHADLKLTVTGADGFALEGTGTMRAIGRDPLALVAQATALHQYPDGLALFCGTLFEPTQDRGAPGSGFTHHVGDVVRIRSARLGELMNRIELCQRLTPWAYGVRDLMRHVAARGSAA